MTTDDPVFAALLAEAQRVLTASPACHDWDHTERVLHTARRLAVAEGADGRIVEFAAVLHDIGRPEELADQGRTCHAELGAQRVAELLPRLGVRNPAFFRAVAHCVRTHRHRRRDGEPAPATLEAKIVHDADKLDAIGAVGLGRAFHFAGRVGARVHNTEAEAVGSASYSRDDTAYREYLVKLRHLRDGMLTAAGREAAAGRHGLMAEFFTRLDREVAGTDW